MSVQKIESGRAAYAYKEVEKHMTKYPQDAAEYAAYLKKIPSMIQVNGLGQALAFCFSKNKYRPIYDQIESWMKEEPLNRLGAYENGTMIEKIISLDSASYRAVTREVLALLSWMVRFAEGLKETIPATEQKDVVS